MQVKGTIDSLLSLKNEHKTISFSGDVHYTAETTTDHKVVLENQEKVIIRPGGSVAIPIILPASEDPVTVTVSLRVGDVTFLKQRIHIPFVLKE